MECHSLLLTMVVYKITVINSRELIRLIRTDTWGPGVEMICVCSVLFIQDILKCVVKPIATDLFFKSSYTLVMACV